MYTAEAPRPHDRRRLLLAIETSCDETAAAIVDVDRRILSNVVATQTRLHQRFGGVVPEIASRAHVERILPVVEEALQQAAATLADLEAIAAVTQPGLVGSLLVGLTAAKTLAMVLDVPFIAVDHLQAHIYACRLAAQRDVYPAVGLVVSGGHCNLYDCRSAVDFELLGATIDDAAGEAFDKVAAILGLSYPGGPSIQQAARKGNATAIRFPRSFLHDDRLEFSFSGLKTAVLYHVAGQQVSQHDPSLLSEQEVADVAASFQEAVVDVLIAKCKQALQQRSRGRLCVGGGVAANQRFRQRLDELAEQLQIEIIIPPISLCTDNAAMAAIAWEWIEQGKTTSLDAGVTAGLVRKSK